MPDSATTDRGTIGQRCISAENLERAAALALAQRRTRGRIMTYELEGWIVREFPGQRIVRLAPVGHYRSEDFPVQPGQGCRR